MSISNISSNQPSDLTDFRQSPYDIKRSANLDNSISILQKSDLLTPHIENTLRKYPTYAVEISETLLHLSKNYSEWRALVGETGSDIMKACIELDERWLMTPHIRRALSAHGTDPLDFAHTIINLNRHGLLQDNRIKKAIINNAKIDELLIYLKEKGILTDRLIQTIIDRDQSLPTLSIEEFDQLDRLQLLTEGMCKTLCEIPTPLVFSKGLFSLFSLSLTNWDSDWSHRHLHRIDYNLQSKVREALTKHPDHTPSFINIIERYCNIRLDLSNNPIPNNLITFLIKNMSHLKDIYQATTVLSDDCCQRLDGLQYLALGQGAYARDLTERVKAGTNPNDKLKWKAFQITMAAMYQEKKREAFIPALLWLKYEKKTPEGRFNRENLSSLAGLPIDVMKIVRSFLKYKYSPEDQALLERLPSTRKSVDASVEYIRTLFEPPEEKDQPPLPQLAQNERATAEPLD